MPEDLAAQVNGMKAAVSDGTLSIEPGVAERCATHCEAIAQGVRAEAARLLQAANLPGFGTLESGVALQRGFERKAVEAGAQLTVYADIADNMAATFREIVARFGAQDSAGAAAFDGVAGEGRLT